jgi:hypothetical protein
LLKSVSKPFAQKRRLGEAATGAATESAAVSGRSARRVFRRIPFGTGGGYAEDFDYAYLQDKKGAGTAAGAANDGLGGFTDGGVDVQFRAVLVRVNGADAENLAGAGK